MSDEPQTPQTNPFQEVCVYLSRQGNDLAMAALIKRFGFSVYAFVSMRKLLQHLNANPLTAAVFVQGNRDVLEAELRQQYHGPVYGLAEDPPRLLEKLGQDLREVHRNQLKVQDPKVLRILKTFDAFCRGAQRTLLLLGSEATLDVATEYLRLFLDAPLETVPADLPTDPPEPGKTAYLTRGLFTQSIPWQQHWNMLYGDGECRHIIAEAMSVDDLDKAYLDGKLDEMVYERLSFRQINVEPLSGHPLEELCVQPLHKSDPRLVFDADADPGPDDAPEAPQEKEPKKGGTFFGLFGKG